VCCCDGCVAGRDCARLRARCSHQAAMTRCARRSLQRSLLRTDHAALATSVRRSSRGVTCAPTALWGASTPRDARRATLGQGHPSRAGSFRSELSRFRRSCLPAGVPLGPPRFLECHARRTAPRCARHPTARSARRAAWVRIACARPTRAAVSQRSPGMAEHDAPACLSPLTTRAAPGRVVGYLAERPSGGGRTSCARAAGQVGTAARHDRRRGEGNAQKSAGPQEGQRPE
jgi:hypothetical protein